MTSPDAPAQPGADGSAGRLAQHHDPARTVTRLEASRGWVALGLGDVWEYRELLWFLAVRDIKVRYKQTVLGAGWAILQPVATTVVFALVFGRLAKLPSDGVPYPIFALAGLVIWNFFSASVGTTSLCLVNNTNLLSKVYFPRLCVPFASMVVFLVDLLVSAGVLLVAMAFYGVGGGWRLLATPLFVLLGFTAALGLSLWLSAVAARYRDVRHVVPFLLQFALFATPVAYSSSIVPERWRVVYGLNPMAGTVEGFRWATLGSHPDLAALLPSSCVVALLLLVTGAFYFRRMERDLADVL